MRAPATPLAAVVFDVDGTLVDSERDGHRVAFNEAFAELGLPYRWEPQFYGELLETAGGRHRLREFLLSRGHSEAAAATLSAHLHTRKSARFLATCEAGNVPPRPGVARLLDDLEAAGVTLAVATTGSRAWVEPLLDRLFGLARFAVVLTGDDVTDRKPDPAVYHLAVAQLGVPRTAVVVVEDSRNGLLAARRAGLTCLVVVNDYTKGHDLTGAAAVVDGFEQAAVMAGPPEVLTDGAVRLDGLARLLPPPSDDGRG